MKQSEKTLARRIGPLAALALSGPAVLAQAALAQDAPLPPAPSAVTRPLQLKVAPGVMIDQQHLGAMTLTLDDAIALALKNNTQLLLSTQQEKYVRGQTLTVSSVLTPNLEFKAYTQAQEINLAAMGFKPSTLSGLKIPGFDSSGIKTIVKINTTDAQVSLSQPLFNLPSYYLYRAAQKAGEAANWATLSARGAVVLQTGSLYLRILADHAQVVNAAALVREDRVVYEHAKASKEAGVGINLDVLRAQVELQNEQQQVIRAENAEAKDKIALNRAMGQPAGQELTLVDTVPFAEFEEMTLGDALNIAYQRRKDLRGLEAQLEVASKTEKAVKYERVPTLGVGGFYGVLGETTGLYHGVFTAEGKLSVPIFQEAQLRGQMEVARAQVMAVQQQIDGRRATIEGDIRSSMLDVDSARELVKVARSNVQLSQQALDDATLRFTSGVDDNLPVVRAQTTLVGAQNSVIQAEFQYNYAKLQLARNTGVVETEYKRYLGK